MNRFVRPASAALVALATTTALAAPSEASRPKEIFPTKNSTYTGGDVDTSSSAGDITATVKIKIGSDNHVAKRVKLKMTCAGGTFSKTLKNYEITHSVVFELTDEFEIRGEWQNKSSLIVTFSTSSTAKACPGEFFEFTATKVK